MLKLEVIRAGKDIINYHNGSVGYVYWKEAQHAGSRRYFKLSKLVLPKESHPLDSPNVATEWKAPTYLCEEYTGELGYTVITSEVLTKNVIEELTVSSNVTS